MNRDKTIIEHISEHAKKINNKIKDITIDNFLINEDLKDIICFNFLQIGELVKSLSNDFCNKNIEIKWSEIAKFRDKIAHGYGTLNFEKIYLYSLNEIPFLLKVCNKILLELK